VIDDGFPTSGWSNGNLTEYGETTYSGMSNFQNNLNASNIGQSGIFRWGVYDGNVEEEEEELPVKKTTSNHELVTLLTNPMDTSGVRTMDLNYYMNDPIIWGSDVKNITVWLETEIFDLAVAKQKAKLPMGLMLLKDYNIRLMMKIVYNDGTVETKEVDNAHIARNIPVLIPVDEFAGTSDLGIVYMDTEGNTAVLPVTPVIIDGMNYLKFENNHFSEYGVVSGTAMTPAEQQQYIIQPGDTLASIAANFGVTVQSLAAANNISNLDMIYAGKVLIIA
jgi:LysM repeat protein